MPRLRHFTASSRTQTDEAEHSRQLGREGISRSVHAAHPWRKFVAIAESRIDEQYEDADRVAITN
jgi:hypothetical protein